MAKHHYKEEREVESQINKKEHCGDNMLCKHSKQKFKHWQPIVFKLQLQHYIIIQQYLQDEPYQNASVLFL